MIALLRQVADPGHGRGRAVGGDAHAPHHDRHAGRARLFVEDERRVGLPVHAARRRAAGAPTRSSTRTRDDIGQRSTADLDVLLAEC